MSHFGPAVAYEKANDPLFWMRAYRLAVDLLDVAWQDAKTLGAEPVTERIAGQRYAAVSSIRLNVLEELRRLLLAIIPRERAKGIPRTK